jgi:hypothetical protein
MQDGLGREYGPLHDEVAPSQPEGSRDGRSSFRRPRHHQGHLCRRGIPISLEYHPLAGSLFQSPREEGLRGRGRSPKKQKSWRRIDGHNQLPKLIQGVKFADGIEVIGNSAVSQAQAAA